MKHALVCGAGGFIGGHLVKRLKADGYWVRGVDLKEHEFSPTEADDFVVLRLFATSDKVQGQILLILNTAWDWVFVSSPKGSFILRRLPTSWIFKI